MTNLSNDLPPKVLSALSLAEERKAAYLESQERLLALAGRLEKHQKSAAAAQAEADHSDALWREQFRANDGEMTKELRALKASGIEAGQLVEEYLHMAKTLEPEYELCRQETALARDWRDSACNTARRLYVDHLLEASIVKLFSSPEALPFLEAINAKRHDEKTDFKDSELSLYHFIHDEMPSALSQIDGRLLNDVLKKAVKSMPEKPGKDPVLSSLRPVARVAGEPERNSLAARNRARKEALKAVSVA